jgi:hypothetical protein
MNLNLAPIVVQNKVRHLERATTRLYRHIVSTFDLPPLQGASLWGRFPGLKPWAEPSSPFGAKIFWPTNLL